MGWKWARVMNEEAKSPAMREALSLDAERTLEISVGGIDCVAAARSSPTPRSRSHSARRPTARRRPPTPRPRRPQWAMGASCAPTRPTAWSTSARRGSLPSRACPASSGERAGATAPRRRRERSPPPESRPRGHHRTGPGPTGPRTLAALRSLRGLIHERRAEHFAPRECGDTTRSQGEETTGRRGEDPCVSRCG